MVRGSEATCFLGLLIPKIGGARRDRTADLLRARQALSQLSYGPNKDGLYFPAAALAVPYHNNGGSGKI